MQVTETLAEGLKREFAVVVSADEINNNITTRLKELSKTITLSGFRPGKVPVALLKKRVGSSIMGEVLEKIVNETSQKALSDQKLRPVLQPSIEITSFKEGCNLEYKMAVELFPKFDLIDFSKLTFEKSVVKVTEAEVDKALERIASDHKTSSPIKDSGRKIKKDDIAVIDFRAQLDGDELPGTAAKDYQLEIGSGSFIAGFEDQLIGASIGESRDIKVTFPKDYGAENLAGKDVLFKVTVKEIHVTAPAEIDDKLAQKANFDDLNALKIAIRKTHQKHYDSISRMHLKESLLDVLANSYDFELPVSMLNAAAKNIARESASQSNQKQEKTTNKTTEETVEITDEHRSLAERQTRLGLLLFEIGSQNNIQVSQDDINRSLAQKADQFLGKKDQFIKLYQDNPQMMEHLKTQIHTDKVLDFILERVSVREKQVTSEELLKD